MSYFDSSNEATVYKQELNYTYDDFTLYKRDIATPKDFYTLPYIKFLYSYPTPHINMFFSKINPNAWITTNAYVMGLLHNNITGLTDDPTSIVGELVIEHKPMTNDNGKKIYTCFLIGPNADSSATLPKNDIDNIINWPPASSPSGSVPASITTNLSQSIPKQNNYIYYTDPTTNNIVIIFLTPILVKTENANTINGYSNEVPTGDNNKPLFSINAPNKYTSGENPVNEDNSDIYIDCQPTGVSDTEIQTYSLPINSEMANNKGQLDFMKTTVNFFVFVILIGLVYFAMPALYKGVVIDIVQKDSAFSGNKDKLTRIRSIDYFISLVFIINIFICFFKGFSSDQTELLTAGLFLFVIYILSFVLIQNKKTDIAWMDNLKYDGEGAVKFLYTDFAMFLGDGTGYVIQKASQFYLAILLVLLILVSIPLYAGSIDTDSANYILTLCAIVLLPVSIIIRLMIDKNNTKASV